MHSSGMFNEFEPLTKDIDSIMSEPEQIFTIQHTQGHISSTFGPGLVVIAPATFS